MNPYSDFSFNLASAFLQSHAKETACVSPVSLLLPLAAVASAAEGKTKDEFAKVLGDSVNDPQQLLREMHEICNVLNDCSAVRELTNNITGAKHHVLRPDFVENMRRTFGDGVGMKNGSDDSVTLTNITHFKEDRVTRFSERDEAFYSTPYGVEESGETVPFLHYDEEELGYTKNDQYQSVTIPFKTAAASGENCYMTFAMPFNYSLDDVIASPERMAKILQCQPFGGYSKAEVHLPAFSLKKNGSLKAELEQLGLHRAFDKYASAIPNMVNLHLNENLYIESVNQEIMVDVNAQGAEARAKTEILMSAFLSCTPVKPFKTILRFNHPFLFTIWLRTPSGDALPLFIGAKR